MTVSIRLLFMLVFMLKSTNTTLFAPCANPSSSSNLGTPTLFALIHNMIYLTHSRAHENLIIFIELTK